MRREEEVYAAKCVDDSWLKRSRVLSCTDRRGSVLRPDNKPSSVLDDNLSIPYVAAWVKPYLRKTPGRRILPVDVAPDRVYRATRSPARR